MIVDWSRMVLIDNGHASPMNRMDSLRFDFVRMDTEERESLTRDARSYDTETQELRRLVRGSDGKYALTEDRRTVLERTDVIPCAWIDLATGRLVPPGDVRDYVLSRASVAHETPN